jgi:hypothetical protein
MRTVDPSDRAVKCLGLQPLGCWYYGFRIPPGTWMTVCCKCCVCLCEGLITHPEESYRVWCVLSVIGILDNEVALVHYGAVAP